MLARTGENPINLWHGMGLAVVALAIVLAGVQWLFRILG